MSDADKTLVVSITIFLVGIALIAGLCFTSAWLEREQSFRCIRDNPFRPPVELIVLCKVKS